MKRHHCTYPVRLSQEQRRFLEALVQTSRTPAKHYLTARVLLMSDQSQSEHHQTDGQIAEALSISRRTVIRIKQRFVQEHYEVFEPEQAKALADRLEIHYTPKHASWLNSAEIELSVLARQGLAHNIASIEVLCQQVQSWEEHRNQRVGTVKKKSIAYF